MSREILVVEDEAVTAAEIRQTLSGLGYEVPLVSDSAESALEWLERSRPDLVLMDIMLAGEMDGVQAAETIREIYDVPVVFLTAHTDDHTLSRVKRTAPYGYLVKPFGATELRITIETAVYRRHMEQKLRESEEKLRQAQRMEALGSMARGITHDFNNILSAIIGYSEMCLAKLPEHDPNKGKLEKIHKAGNRAKNLVRMLLAFGKHGGGRTVPVELAPLVEEALDIIGPSLNGKVDVRSSLDPEAGPVLGEANQLLQVLLNLLGNAAEAMPGGGVLSVELAASSGNGGPGMVRLAVQDTGEGIAHEDRARIFDPYFSTKASGEGSGMGLSVVHSIVAGFGGHLRFLSEPGRGTRFEVFLPAASGAGGS
jgi:signal transduction histidine kinase